MKFSLLFFLNLLRIIFSSKKVFACPKKSNYLLLDSHFSDWLNQMKLTKFQELDIRLNKINFYVILKLILKKQNINMFNYSVEYIRQTDAKLVLSFFDNLTWFYKLKFELPDVKFVAFQNGWRAKYFFKTLKELKPLKCDTIFVLNKNFSREYKKVINTKTINIGSYKNNLIKKQKKIKKKNSIFFIATGWQFEAMTTNKKYDASEILCETLYQPDTLLVKNLFNYCQKKNLKFEIIGKRKDDYHQEMEFYKKILKSNNFTFHQNNGRGIVYRLADKSLVNVVTHSSFGGECLSRRNKTVIFNNKSRLGKSKISKNYYDMFWFTNLKKRGLFWSDTSNYDEVERVLNYAVSTSQKTWDKKTKKTISELMVLNQGNRIFKNFLSHQ